MDTKYNYSIIIPHFNIPNLLVRCLKSIPERDDIQVIVVDDQSKGCETYMDTIPQLHRMNVEFYIVDEKKFAGHARNVGLDHAMGKWLMFADPDDFFFENYISITDRYLNDEADVIYFNFRCCDNDDTSKTMEGSGVKRFAKYQQTKNELIFRLDFSEPWGKMVKHKFVEENNIRFQETRAHNDLFFGVKVGILAKQIKTVDEPIYWYVYRQGSTGHSVDKESYEKLKDRLFAWNSVQSFLEENGYRTETYLPVKTCIRVIRNDFPMYCCLIKYMKSQNMRYGLALLQSLRITMEVLCGGKGPGFASEVYKVD